MKKSKREYTSVDMNQWMTDYLKELIDKTSRTDTPKNNSFIFLEDETLHMLLLYLLMNHNNHTVTNKTVDLSQFEKQLNLYIDNNRRLYDELVQILKEKAEGSSDHE